MATLNKVATEAMLEVVAKDYKNPALDSIMASIVSCNDTHFCTTIICNLIPLLDVEGYHDVKTVMQLPGVKECCMINSLGLMDKDKEE